MQLPSISSYLEDSLACPSSMVDRIVPHTTEMLRAQVTRSLVFEDAWPVATEAFSQWVLEDRFAGPRPRLEELGVQFVNDVAPYEAMKLRLLNAAHSAIAYLGVPAGWQTVDQAIAQPALLRFIERLWADEIIPSPAAGRFKRRRRLCPESARPIRQSGAGASDRRRLQWMVR